MERRKNVWSLLSVGILILGTISELVRAGLHKVLPVFPKQVVLYITDERVIWDPFVDAQWFAGCGFLLNAIAAGVGVVLVVSLFADAKGVSPGSGKQAIMGTILGLAGATAILPGVTMVQVIWLIVGLGFCFGFALGVEYINSVGLFGTFGAVLGVSIWIFFLYGGVLALFVTAVLSMVNLACIFIGFLIGCAGAAIRKKIARKKA